MVSIFGPGRPAAPHSPAAKSPWLRLRRVLDHLVPLPTAATQASTKTTSAGSRSCGSPTLYLVEPMSAIKLSQISADSQEGWFAGEDKESLCEKAVEHRRIEDAPAEAQALALELHRALDGATVPAGEKNTIARVVVIGNPGENVKEACLEALGIKKEVDEVALWDMAELIEKDWRRCTEVGFCFGHDDEEGAQHEVDGSDKKRILAATKIMAEKLKNHFQFGFNEEIVVAPVISGGFVSDGSIVGVLSMRVWH